MVNYESERRRKTNMVLNVNLNSHVTEHVGNCPKLYKIK